MPTITVLAFTSIEKREIIFDQQIQKENRQYQYSPAYLLDCSRRFDNALPAIASKYVKQVISYLYLHHLKNTSLLLYYIIVSLLNLNADEITKIMIHKNI